MAINHSESSRVSTLVTILGTTLAVGTISSLGWYYYFTTHTSKKNYEGNGSPSKDGLSMTRRLTSTQLTASCSSYSEKFKPPFPKKVRDMLSKSHLLYLSTMDATSNSSHLSLMRFTYLQHPKDGEVVIMSTNRNTKKFNFLKRQQGVALLVHDFGSGATNNNGMYSITLNGQCRILESGTSKAEEYRQAHLKHNPDYPQFIVGDDIDILCVDVSSARICDIQDQVIQWNVQDNHKNAALCEEGEFNNTSKISTSKKLVGISFRHLKELFGDTAAYAIRNDVSSFDAVSPPQYATWLQTLPLSHQDLLRELLDRLQLAFGPDGLGFLEVTNVPMDIVALRSTLLPMAEKLAHLPKTELQTLERPDQGWTIGWSHGKEHFQDGTYDMSKGSFYMNPIYGTSSTNDNIYPPSLQPQLEEQLETMTRFMVKVGMWVAVLCDLYLQKAAETTIEDPWMISKSLATGLAAKARMLYYYPKITTNDARKELSFDDWCGQHKDHGSITALLPGMLCNQQSQAKEYINGNETTCQHDPYPAGLYIENRSHELVYANLASTSLGFQLGETLQIMSRGKFRATPHSVKAPSDQYCGRASLAVFLQPLPNQALPSLTEDSDVEADDRYALQDRWRPTFGEFQQATTDKFN